MVLSKVRNVLNQPIRVDNSLHLRLFLPLAAVIVGTLVLLTLYSLGKFEEASTFQLRHEALVLSDTLEAVITPLLAGEPDAERIQAHIDRLVGTRERNDIEINVMVLEGNRSAIIASNIPDNIEKTDFYEHRAIREALEKDEVSFFVGRDTDDAFEPPRPPTHPDYYVGGGNRFVSVTSPLFVEGRGIGAINTKLSLQEIDLQLATVRRRVVAAVIIVPMIALLLIHWIVRRGLVPLNRIARKTGELGAANLEYRFPVEGLPRELRPICVRLNDLFERLEAAFDRERRFSANVAHELRTPITELHTLSEVWLEYGPDRKQERDMTAVVRDVLAITTQMERMITALTALVRSESGRARVNLEKADLTVLIRKAWQSLEPSARKESLSPEFNLPDTVPVETDGNLMMAILTNLFSNAVSYTPDGGSIRCTLESKNGAYRIDLENTSRDLDPGDILHLSEPFWRGDTARTDGGHSGLGLSLVAAYARLLHIDFEIALPEPDLFRVRLCGRPPGDN